MKAKRTRKKSRSKKKKNGTKKRARKAAKRAKRRAKRRAKKAKRKARRKAAKVASTPRPKRSAPTGGRIMGRKKKGKGGSSGKKGFPGWVKPTLAMIVFGGVGLVVMPLLPDAIGPFAPAVGVLAAKFLGGGSWGKYLTTAGVVGGVTFLSQRRTVQVAAGALSAAKAALVAGGGGGAGGASTAAEKGAAILREVPRR